MLNIRKILGNITWQISQLSHSVGVSDILNFPREKTAKIFLLNSLCLIYVARIFQKLCVPSTCFHQPLLWELPEIVLIAVNSLSAGCPELVRKMETKWWWWHSSCKRIQSQFICLDVDSFEHSFFVPNGLKSWFCYVPSLAEWGRELCSD